MFNRKYIFKGSNFSIAILLYIKFIFETSKKKRSAQQAQNTPRAANTLSKRFRDQCREKRILMRTLLQASHYVRDTTAPRWLATRGFQIGFHEPRPVCGWTNPSEKYAEVKLDHLPKGSGWKSKILYLSCHHLDEDCSLLIWCEFSVVQVSPPFKNSTSEASRSWWRRPFWWFSPNEIRQIREAKAREWSLKSASSPFRMVTNEISTFDVLKKTPKNPAWLPFKNTLSFLTHRPYHCFRRCSDPPRWRTTPANPGNSALAEAVLLLTVMPSSEGQVHPQKYVVRCGNSVWKKDIARRPSLLFNVPSHPETQQDERKVILQTSHAPPEFNSADFCSLTSFPPQISETFATQKTSTSPAGPVGLFLI